MCMQVESPVVWSHNDLLSGNILVLGGKKLPDGEDDVQFIDFEYGSHAPRGFDIGNHWNEYAGFDLEWERFPARDKQEVFVREYLSAGGAAPERRDVERLVREANVYALASHLFWGYWAILQARWSQIDFDYMSYYGKRLTRMRQLMRTVAAD
ncbi:unnamed protein product [Pedinophyceae sp. YPF-701]|nr:unnamed protein product [Pedinophyceae sp. YPF-701]